ncbi:DUF1987 domain-containing protein [Microscilla marina]|uniref:SiaC family regulatory phosphoprotein domain-containing protein n=1 Tax=Microscilla marina ATCC 23134 TaxID=313606 RepID=A1ZJP6_MICM2|nr:DUF1987 domain-containing protein [Microscilla marina]EAY29349.1 conserved hypothetical protein [Microscilla marina ATCC 23134]
MENLYIKGQRGIYFTPTVKLDAEASICEISGESYLEDTVDFYDPIIKWLNAYNEESYKTLTFNFKLTYFNTSSSKAILNILKSLKKFKEKGGEIVINWYYPDDDYDILAEAEDFMEDSKLSFNLIPYKLEY